MAAKPMPRLFTVDEYYRMGEVGILTEDDCVELIEGKIIQMPPVGSRHASCVLRINRLFSQSLGSRALVAVQNPLRLSTLSEPVPDVMILRWQDDFYEAEHPKPRDTLIAIEVSDTTLTHDQRVKLPLYARENVPEVWIVELARARISVHREPSMTGYRFSQILQRGDQITPEEFPDLTFAVSDILV